MATPIPFPISSAPGIKRDSTQFEGDNYTDGQWCRFSARGLPRKIAGYRSITSHLNEVVRGMDAYMSDAIDYLHLGSRSFMTQVQVTIAGALGSQNDRTPAGFAANANNLWQVVAFYNKVGGTTMVVAHAGQNLADISSQVETPIYFGPVDALTPLVASAMDPVGGGIIPVPPYLMAYGVNGRVDVSAINDLTVATANSTFVTSQKVVKGLPLRNTTAPAAILWSLDTLVSAIFDPAATTAAGGIPVFDFNEIGEISVLSSQGIVEYDTIYYWPGVDRFYMFNGVVRELPNNLNINFFFENMNFAQRQKAFTFKVPRHGEVWFCAPLFGATECNWAVIHNVRLNTWYDTPLPDGGRSAAVFAKVYQKPFMCDVDLTLTGFTLWQHETGVNKLLNSASLPIQSFYQTHEISPVSRPQGATDKAYRVSIVEPDFKQVGNLRCTVHTRANARTPEIIAAPMDIPDTATGPSNQVAYTKTNGRLMAFRFESNSVDGDFEAGRVIGHLEETDGRITQ